MRDQTEVEGEKPDWWRENESLREEMSLPPYRPSIFTDGTYTHTVVADLEAEFGCTIRFVAVNPEYPDDWEVRINDRSVFEIGRYRDENGNTVYEMTAKEFRNTLRERLRE